MFQALSGMLERAFLFPQHEAIIIVFRNFVHAYVIHFIGNTSCSGYISHLC